MMENNGRCVREGHMLFRILLMKFWLCRAASNLIQMEALFRTEAENRRFPFDSCFRHSSRGVCFGNISRRKGEMQNLPFQEVVKRASLAEVWIKAATDVRIQEGRS
jgi:hypothetical protein